MPEFVTLTLVAPLGAFGDLAGHERRGTALWPGRSAILGLVGAALGVRRDDAKGKGCLDGWQMAVSVLTAGHPLRDYHTVQTVPARFKRPNSRREALASAGRAVNTTITQRDYRSDVCFGVALWPMDPTAPPMALGDLVQALERPIFALWLGRKSCPLSAPLDPRVRDASNPLEAVRAIRMPPWLQSGTRRGNRVPLPDPSHPLFIAADPYDGLSPDRVEARWDRAIDRGAWHFAQREVHIHQGSEAHG